VKLEQLPEWKGGGVEGVHMDVEKKFSEFCGNLRGVWTRMVICGLADVRVLPGTNRSAGGSRARAFLICTMQISLYTFTT
jgi:hypothetical protein